MRLRPFSSSLREGQLAAIQEIIKFIYKTNASVKWHHTTHAKKYNAVYTFNKIPSLTSQQQLFFVLYSMKQLYQMDRCRDETQVPVIKLGIKHNNSLYMQCTQKNLKGFSLKLTGNLQDLWNKNSFSYITACLSVATLLPSEANQRGLLHHSALY